MSIQEQGCSLASTILYDDGISVTVSLLLFARLAEKISTLLKAANLNVESYWVILFAKLAEKKDLGDLIMNIGSGGGGAPVAIASAGGDSAGAAAPPPEEKKEEPKEESNDDMGFSLFD